MSISVLFNGITYSIPETGEESWGEDLTSYFVAIPSGALQKSGGTFTLTADVNFGANFGLLSKYFSTRTALPSTAGLVRLAVTDTIGWRNNANGGNLLLAVNGSDQLTFNGTAIYPAGITALTGDVTATGPGSAVATIAANAVTNAKFRQSVALSVVGNSTNATANVADITAGTDGFILRRSGTALGFALLVNANVDAAAAIDYSKLAALTVSRALVSSAGGVIVVATTTATEIGYVNGVTSAIQTQLDAKLTATLTNGNIFVGNVSNVAASVTPTGDVTISNAGVTTIGPNKVTNAMLATAASAATASYVALRDANANLLANNHLDGYATTATAAATTTLLVGSARLQFFTGVTTQTVALPVTSTLALGQQFVVVNNSSGAVTVNSSGGNAVQVMAASSIATFTCILTSGTSAASWYVAYSTSAAGGGSVTSVAMTVPTALFATSPVSGSPVTTSGTLAPTLATQTARTFFQGPQSGSAATPTFAALTVRTLQKYAATPTQTGWLFTISTSSTLAVGDTYTNNGNTYTVLGALSAQNGQVLFMSGTGATSGGTLTRATGAGTASITFTSKVALGTYTTPTNPAPLWIEVELSGAGGGGGASGTSGGGAGAAGTSSFFGPNLISATGGSFGDWAGSTAVGGAGGVGSLGTATGDATTGGKGQGANSSVNAGGQGGVNPRGGNGGGGLGGSSAGSAGAANTGAGGGGGGAAVTGGAGGAGGAGGWVRGILSSLAASYPVVIGTGGAAGTAGVSGQNGGAGADGTVLVWEIYQ